MKPPCTGGQGVDGRTRLHELIHPHADAIEIVVGRRIDNDLVVARLTGEHLGDRRSREHPGTGHAIDTVVE